MSMVKIYHNKLCSKSCAALDLLYTNNVDLVVQEYIDQVPTKKELTNLLYLLKLKPLQLIRHQETIFQENFTDLILTDAEWIDVMLQYPILIERPIVVKDGRAVIGRPIENIINLLQEF